MEIEIQRDQIYGDLTVLSKDLGRRSNGGGFYWKCRCVCGKMMSIKDSRLVDGYARSCKDHGRPCKAEKYNMIKPESIYFEYEVVSRADHEKKNERGGGAKKNYYIIKCVHCGRQEEKRGDVIINGTRGNCPCGRQSTEKPQKISSYSAKSLPPSKVS